MLFYPLIRGEQWWSICHLFYLSLLIPGTCRLTPRRAVELRKIYSRLVEVNKMAVVAVELLICSPMLFEGGVVLAFFGGQIFLWDNYGHVLLGIDYILLNIFCKLYRLISQRRYLVHLETLLQEFLLGSHLITAEYHLLYLVFQRIVLDHCSEFLYKVRPCIPFIVLRTFLILPGYICH